MKRVMRAPLVRITCLLTCLIPPPWSRTSTRTLRTAGASFGSTRSRKDVPARSCKGHHGPAATPMTAWEKRRIDGRFRHMAHDHSTEGRKRSSLMLHASTGVSQSTGLSQSATLLVGNGQTIAKFVQGTRTSVFSGYASACTIFLFLCFYHGRPSWTKELLPE